MDRRRLLLVLGTLLPFGVGEAYLQVVDPFYFCEREDWAQYVAAIIDPETRGLRKNTVATYLGKKTVISSQGWRSPVFEEEKPDGVYRILLLGGSVPYGWGVAQGEEYPRVLEKMLNDAGRVPGKRIEVINTGVPGWSLAQEGGLLRRVVSVWNPDLVLLTLVASYLPLAFSGEWQQRMIQIMSYLNVNGHYEAFRKGLIDTSNFVYFLSGIALFLVLAVKTLESRRWR